MYVCMYVGMYESFAPAAQVHSLLSHIYKRRIQTFERDTSMLYTD